MFRKFFTDNSQSTEASPQVEIEQIKLENPKEKTESPVLNKKEEIKHEEDDDLFKEMTPNYIAAKRIGPTVLENEEKPSSIRFEMEIDHTHSWDVEELT